MPLNPQHFSSENSSSGVLDIEKSAGYVIAEEQRLKFTAKTATFGGCLPQHLTMYTSGRRVPEDILCESPHFWVQ